MGTTIWLDKTTREELRRMQQSLGAKSAAETVRRLMTQPGSDARTLFAKHREGIRAIIRRHQVRKLIAFGSRARGDARPDSDLDIAVEVAPGAPPFAPISVEIELRELLGVKVNVVDLPNPALRAAIRRDGVPFEGG